MNTLERLKKEYRKATPEPGLLAMSIISAYWGGWHVASGHSWGIVLAVIAIIIMGVLIFRLR